MIGEVRTANNAIDIFNVTVPGASYNHYRLSFLPCGVYGVGLGLLIIVHYISYAPLSLFMKQPEQNLTTHAQDWMDWHSLGCFFMGTVNLLAWKWEDVKSRRDVAGATGLLYLCWAIQNLTLMFTDRFETAMWFNVIGCAIAGAWSISCTHMLQTSMAQTALGLTLPTLPLTNTMNSNSTSVNTAAQGKR